MDIPKQIFEKYDGLAEGSLIFPVPSYKMLMYYLKIIAKRCGIEKRASWHQRRHSNLSLHLKERMLQRQKSA